MFRVGLRPWFMWFFVLCFFAYQFVMRLYPGLVMQDIMQKFQVDATAFGFFSSMYYFGYAGMQIPMAILLDRFGPRRVVTFFALLCSVATLSFVYTDSWPLVLVARFLIGVGSAVGFLGTSKVISLYFPQNRYAQMVGLSFTFGLMGALYGGSPTSLLVDKFGWEWVGFAIFGVGCAIAVGVLILVRDKKPTKVEASTSVLTTLKTILTSPRILVMALANLLMVGSLEGFADVWGVTYLMKSYGFDKATAASATSFIFVGMLFGGPILATVSERLKAYYQVTAACGFLTAAIFVAMLASNGSLSYPTLCALMFCTGVLCCYQVLVFAVGSQLVSVAMMGVTIAFLNSINMFGGSFFHLVIGSLLDWFWTGGQDEGLRVYTAANYTAALFAIPAAALVGAVLFLLVKPKRVT
jgi:MFS family permease